MTAPISLTLHRGSNICVERGLFDKTGPRTYLFRHRCFNLTFSRGPVMSRRRKPLKQTYGLAINLFERDRKNVALPWESQTPGDCPTPSHNLNQSCLRDIDIHSSAISLKIHNMFLQRIMPEIQIFIILADWTVSSRASDFYHNCQRTQLITATGEWYYGNLQYNILSFTGYSKS